ncbi:ABC transporter permease [Micromonospora sp. NPDC047527]|uniref:ABC transporter permease n=1 Tax=unclassified Micromonospora TaxID=2617518 RepID=UPI0033CFC631
MGLIDWAREATLSVMRHPGRALMTAVGTVLGAVAFVATLGISSTISQQVSSSFDIRRATEVVVSPQSKGLDIRWQDAESLTRLRGLNGVVDAGSRISLGEQPIARGLGAPTSPFAVFGVDPGALAAIEPRLTVGRSFDAFHESRGANVVLLSQPVADSLGITRVGAAVFIHDRAFTVMGIFYDVGRRQDSLTGALMPASTAEILLESYRQGAEEDANREVLIRTSPGAAQLIGSQAATALHPESPQDLRVVAPPDPRQLRREVEGNVALSTVLLSIVALAVGAVTIANAAAASVTTRVAEIGLRRALGARPSHIFAQLVGETTVLGTIGGAVGVLIGVATVATVSIVNRWSPVLDMRAAMIAVAASAATGLVAGLWPAARAIRIQPVSALQR